MVIPALFAKYCQTPPCGRVLTYRLQCKGQGASGKTFLVAKGEIHTREVCAIPIVCPVPLPHFPSCPAHCVKLGALDTLVTMRG